MDPGASAAASAAATALAQRSRGGALAAVGGFVIWGLFPLYFHQVASVHPLEVVLHRSVWALVCVLAVLAWMRHFGWLGELWRQPRQIVMLAVSATLIGANWWVYVLAMQSERIVEASLGYFINPLINVVLGVALLGERLRRLQWLAVALAAAGVVWLAAAAGQFPWMGLSMALLFGFYGLVRKTVKVGALEGLAVETALIAPIAVPALLWWTVAHDGAMARGDWALNGWLLLAGPVTALPLLLFAVGARRLKLVTVGLLQYISPTLQFVLGVWVFREPFDASRLAGFVLIWAALAAYTADAVRHNLQVQPTAST